MIMLGDEKTVSPYANLTVVSGTNRAIACVVNEKMFAVVIGEFDPDETTDEAFERLNRQIADDGRG